LKYDDNEEPLEAVKGSDPERYSSIATHVIVFWRPAKRNVRLRNPWHKQICHLPFRIMHISQCRAIPTHTSCIETKCRRIYEVVSIN
jgi:hypothetical protein